jgi:ankyrin repeat protein
MLLAMGVDVNSARGGRGPVGRTPLQRGYEDAARTLLDACADVSARYHDGRTPLHLAAEHGQVDMIELLLERDAHVVAMTPQRETALCMAASHGLSSSRRAECASLSTFSRRTGSGKHLVRIEYRSAMTAPAIRDENEILEAMVDLGGEPP